MMNEAKIQEMQKSFISGDIEIVRKFADDVITKHKAGIPDKDIASSYRMSVLQLRKMHALAKRRLVVEDPENDISWQFFADKDHIGNNAVHARDFVNAVDKQYALGLHPKDIALEIGLNAEELVGLYDHATSVIRVANVKAICSAFMSGKNDAS